MTTDREAHRPKQVRSAPGGRSAYGIGHLLLWLTFCAVHFAATRLLAPRAALAGDVIWLSALAAYTGLAWAGATLVLYRRMRTAHLMILPGEWLLLAFGIMLAIDILIPAAQEANLLFRPEPVAEALTCCVFVMPTLSRRLAISWKLYFGALTLMYAIPLILVSLHSQGTIAPSKLNSILKATTAARAAIALSAIILLVAWDKRAKQHDGLLHFVGVTVAATWFATVTIRLML